ncbi:MAG: formylglycine-generating enzyme family protein [Blastocatellia bacterium]
MGPKPNGDARPAPFPESIAERPARWIERQTPPPATLDRLCGELRAYLGDEGWQWLCAAAVYPAISWEITLYLGRRLLGDHPDFETDFEARLMRLARLPWFRYGQMPDWLRSRLVESFAPGQEDRARRAIEAMLLGALDSPPERKKDGVKLEIARAEEEAEPGWFERLKRRRRATRLGDLLQSEPDESPLRDYVFLSFLSGRKPARLTVGLPRLLRRIFYPRGEPIFGLRPLAGLTLAVAVSVALWIGSGVKPPDVLPSGHPRTFAYVTVTLDAAGNETSRRTLQAEQYVEDLGNGVTIEMARIPGGEFQMGSSEAEAQTAFEEVKRYFKESQREWYTAETPRHPVKVAPFLMGKFEVTQRQWRAVAALPKVKEDLDLNPSRSKEGDDLPVENVTWEQAKEFIARLNAKLGLNETNGYRLPSEAEWEYAARAGGATPFAFGETINPSIVNYNGGYPYGKAPEGLDRGKTVAIGSLGVANAWGLFDMHGNVWEWCEDEWHNNYEGAPMDGRAWVEGSSTGSGRVDRGGGWAYDAAYCRSAYRNGDAPGYRYVALGFRLVRVGP